MDIAIEYKPNEPRGLRIDAGCGDGPCWRSAKRGRPNIGVTLDFAHVLYADEMPAHAAVLAARHAKLLGVHLNDGYGKRDDGLMVASVHPVQTVELMVETDPQRLYGGNLFSTPFRIIRVLTRSPRRAPTSRQWNICGRLPVVLLAMVRFAAAIARQDAPASPAHRSGRSVRQRPMSGGARVPGRRLATLRYCRRCARICRPLTKPSLAVGCNSSAAARAAIRPLPQAGWAPMLPLPAWSARIFLPKHCWPIWRLPVSIPASCAGPQKRQPAQVVAIVETHGDYGAVVASGANQLIEPDDISVPDGTGIPGPAETKFPSGSIWPSARAARANGARILLNAAPMRSINAELLDRVDLLIVNRIEAAALFEMENRTIRKAPWRPLPGQPRAGPKSSSLWARTVWFYCDSDGQPRRLPGPAGVGGFQSWRR